MAKCVLCERQTSGSLEFCTLCYREYKGDIKDKKPWVRAVKNDAQRERRRREKEMNDTSLDVLMEGHFNK
jgi:hypothetical protein